MSEKPLPIVTFDGVPAHRVWRDADGHVWMEFPRPAENFTVIGWYVAVEDSPDAMLHPPRVQAPGKGEA